MNVEAGASAQYMIWDGKSGHENDSNLAYDLVSRKQSQTPFKFGQLAATEYRTPS